MKRLKRPIVALLVLVALPCTAAAQATCPPHPLIPPEPDVIVGELQSVFNYAATGGGTLEALSLGTTSCNMGDLPLNWIANSNQHPVIGGQLYKYKVVNGAGRFEQIGMSWLKHGFFALSENACCANCIGDPDGDHLGVGCSDPYTAQRNGTQSGLGPRYQVNPHSGVFTWPPPHPSGGNTGRQEVLVSDLEPSSPTGTRYFGEGQYITPDDAAAGNGNNNASYREVTVSGSGSTWTFGLSGATQREKQAINAWKVCDPSVTLTPIQLANDGLVIVGYKTTDLGGGWWHYEYAVYNMNSNLAVGKLTIPVADGVAVTNVGFRDVTYRGGDGVGGVSQDGTDWPSVRASNALSWGTQTPAQNANANAIRWATTYNFRFDANTPPKSGTVTLTTWKNQGAVPTSADVPDDPPDPIAFCPGDDSLATACPCLNPGAVDHGCANSQDANGAILTWTGTTSPDTLVLTSSGEPSTALTIFLQGTGVIPTGTVYGDGVRCVAGTLKRLYAKPASGGVVSAPAGADPSITTRSAALGDPLAPGMTRYYQAYYRDPSATFCPDPPGNTWNVSSGLIVTW